MKKRMSPIRLLIVAMFLVIALGGGYVGFGILNPVEPDVRVLFIGNSHTYVNNVPGSVVELADANGVIVEVEVVAPGGHTLREHANDETVQGLVASGDFDFVVLQEQSERPAHYADFNRETAPSADAIARTAQAADVEVIYYQTWGRRDGSPYTGHTSYGEMQSAVTAAYDTLAADTGGEVAPVGETWRYVRRVAPHIELFDADGNHAAPPGSYLAAIVLTETIIDVRLDEAPAVAGVDDQTAGYLLNYAQSAS